MGEMLLHFISRIMGHRAIVFGNGFVSLWRVPVVIIPAEFFFFLLCQGKKIKEAVYLIGKLQGKFGTDLLIKRFNIKPNFTNLQFFHEYAQMVGIGSIETEQNPKERIGRVICRDSTVGQVFLSMNESSSEGDDDYLRGIVTGSFESMCNNYHGKELELTGTEKECLAMKQSACVIDVEPLSGKSEYALLNKIIKKRRNAIIESLIQPIKPEDSPAHPLENKLKQKYRSFATFEGKFTFFGRPCIITTVASFALLQEIIRVIDKGGGHKILLEAGRLQALITFKELIENILSKNEIETLKNALQLINFYGFGRVSLKRFGKEILIVVENNKIAEFTNILVKNTNAPNDYLSGVISGVLELVLKKKYIVKEIDNIPKKKNECIFSATSLLK